MTMKLKPFSCLLLVPVLSVAGCHSLLGIEEVSVEDGGTQGDASGSGDANSACMAEIPDVNGEFLVAVSTVIAPTSLLQFIVTTNLNTTARPAEISMVIQPLCTQDAQCVIGQPVGGSIMVQHSEVLNCEFLVNLDGVTIPGGANTISGIELIASFDFNGSLKSADLYCGGVDGFAILGGAETPIDGSSFGAIRITPGTLGEQLPVPQSACPDSRSMVSAGLGATNAALALLDGGI